MQRSIDHLTALMTLYGEQAGRLMGRSVELLEYARKDYRKMIAVIPTYTHQKITEMATNWRNYQGFTGDHCGECKKTVNILFGGAGWICECGHYNVLPWSGPGRLPYKKPDYGPSRATIEKGHQKAAKLKKAAQAKE